MTTIALPRALSVEVRKYRRTMAIWLAILAPFLIVLLNFFIFYFRGERIIGEDQNAWSSFGGMNIQPSVVLLFPMYVTLLAVWFFQIEHQNHTWKHLWVLPIPRVQQYLAKVLLMVTLVALSLVIFGLLIYVAGNVLAVLRPELGFEDQSKVNTIMKAILWSGAAGLGIIALQFWFSFRWRNLLAPMALGLGGLISANILMRWEHIVWHPFAAPFLAVTKLANPEMEIDIHPLVYGVGFGLIIFIIAFLDGKRKVLKG